MATPRISLVFTDLDNTLYDWVAWYSSTFHRMLDRAAARSDIPRDDLVNEMQQLHRSRHRLEEPEALLHAPSILRRFGTTQEARQALASTFGAYYRARQWGGLRVYPGVRSTLQRLAALGVAVVGHTEAPANHAVARLRALGLEHAFVSLLAAPPAADDPTLVDEDPALLPFTLRCLDPDERKPNPRVVQQLCARLSVSSSAALYVGDSLGQDVGMAQAAGLWTAWARYGTRHDPRDWERVAQVSPWSPDRRVGALLEVPPPEATPHVVLHESFAELLDHFEFAARGPVLSPPIELAVP